ncbi:hypothetical protein [Roseibium aestuarii]|uniref:Bacterial spore germination immunoglobulin-like domain-containing protein n=1 Tax=Roseibium aestuarii TaxID=2600299 RepID=A0ABW4JT86_9HYPH|nr:hypothetical protein [Roseibium aestuarii]
MHRDPVSSTRNRVLCATVAALMLCGNGPALSQSSSPTQTPALSADLPLPEALATARETLDQAWDAAPITLARALFIDGSSAGFGLFTARETAVFAAGKPLHVYLEPVAYGFQTTEGMTGYRMDVSYRLLTPGGQVLASQDGFATITGSARSRKREVSASLRFAFEGLPAGEFRLELTVTDRMDASAGTATVTLPFSVVKGG